MAQTGNGSGPSDKPDHEAPDPTYIGSHPANENVHLLRERKRLSYAANFEKSVPVYNEVTTAWSDHMVAVTACLYMNPVSDKIAKMVLFKKMDSQTFPVVSEGFAPYGEQAKDMNFMKYANLLGEVFQPASESKMLKLTFIECKQQPNEHYETYVRNKYRMWKRAYNEKSRDWDDLYINITNGLENRKARKYMKRFRKPEKDPDIKAYIIELGYYQAELREQYLAGEISYADLKGMESREFLRQNKAKAFVKVKDEGVHTLDEGVHAMNIRSKPQLTCYGCGGHGHIRKNCPRETTGLQTSKLHQLDDNNDDDKQEVLAVAGRTQPSVRRKPFFPKTPDRFKKKQPYRRVVAQIAEGDDGQILAINVEKDFEEDSPSTPPPAEDDVCHFLA